MKTTVRLRSFLALAGSALLTISYTHAASATWDGSTDQTWAEGTNWSGDAAPGATSGTTSTDVATFGTTGSGIITVDALRNILGIDFNGNSNAFTLSGGSLLLTNGGYIKTSGAGSGHTDTISSAIEIQGDGGTAFFTGGSSTATRLLVISGGVTGVSTGANTTTLTLNGANTGGNAVSGVIGNGSGGGKLALVKSGAGTWSVTNTANSFTGGISLGGGTFKFGGNARALNGNNIVFTANTTMESFVNSASPNNVLTGSLTVNNAVTAKISVPSNAWGYSQSGALLGSGTFSLTGASASTVIGNFTNTGNTFTGALDNSTGTTATGGFTFSSIDDSASPGTGAITLGSAGTSAVTFGLNSNLAAPVVFDNRQFVIGTNGSHAVNINNNALGAANTFTVNTALSVTSTGTKTVTFGGANTGNNTFAGNITNGSGTVAIIKADGGTWVLSGTNSYTGGTTITTRKLLFSGADSLPTTGTIAVGAAGHLSLADGTARNQTVSALTLTSLANLSFDWTGSGTGDQLTSTADITPTAASIFAVNLNRSGTPGGSVTLLTGGAGSTLSSSNFYLANLTDYTAALTLAPTTVTVGSYASQTALTTIYWMGNKLAGTSTANVDNAWALSNGTVSNWSSADGTYDDTALTPGSTANVIFSNTLTDRAQQATTLGADVTVNSIVIADANAVSIAGTSNAALTLLSSLSTAGLVDGTPGSAITVTSTANATSTISSRVILGSNQTWNVASGRTLAVSGVVDGAFSLTKADAGTVILNGTNTYSGDTTISAGILRVGNNTTGTLGGGNYAGNIVNNGTLQIWSSAAQTLSGVISGSGVLNKAYGGALTLSGNNTYTGKTEFRPETTTGFTVNVTSFNSVNGGTPLLASSSLGAPTTIPNGTIDLGNGGKRASVTLIYTGTGETTDRVINVGLNSTSNQTIVASGTDLLKFTSNFTGSGASTPSGGLILDGTGAGEISGQIPDFYTGSKLTKNGTGTWTLSGSNAYTGLTTVSGGTLLVNNTTGSGTGSGNVSVTAGTLGGTGAISGAVTIGNSAGTADSILAPGTSIGAIATGNLAFNSDGRYACELNGTSVTSDRVNVTGTVSIDAATSLAVSLTGSLSAGQKYFIVVNDDVDAVTGTFAGLAQDAVVVSPGGTDLKISYTGDSGTNAITGGNDIVLYTDGGGGSPYDTWASSKGLTGLPGSSTDPAKNADPDNDGRNNLGEFAFNGDPLSGSDNGKIFVLTEDSDYVGDPSSAKELILTVAVRTGTPTFAGSPTPSANQASDGITYSIEGSLDLASFPTTVNVVPTPVVPISLPAAGTGYEYRSFSLDGSNGLTGKGFLRAKVTSH